MRAGSGRCLYCAGLRVDPAKAAAEMRHAQLEPVIPYPGTNVAWPCQCLRCGKSVTPTLANIRRGQGGCGYCGRRIVDPAKALDDMRAAGLEPQEPYPGASEKWRCLCTNRECGRLVEPTYNNVISKGVGCRYCALRGIDLTSPACVYVVHHVGEDAVKIGIAGLDARNGRIAKHQRHGWTLIRQLRCATGEHALAIEQAVLAELKARQLGHFMSEEVMPQGGWTETFDAELLNTEQLWRMIVLEAVNQPHPL